MDGVERSTVRMIGDRKMQCKDIPDEVFLTAVASTPAIDGDSDPSAWKMRWDVAETLEKVTGPIPFKLFMAKVRKLIAAGKMGGCDCGCRGDYHLPCRYEMCCTRRNSDE